MASAQVDAVHVEDLTKPSEETTLGSGTVEGSAKAPAPQNIESRYDEEPEDVILSDELGKEDELDDEEDQKGVAPQSIEDDDDDDVDDEEQAEERAAKSAVRVTDFSEEEGDDDV
ncbi:hypothetical protein L6452_02575 [Arctium lappa]|uniref:Uncharacterized protein n=1 Tax=Arctium lappa TaxID=4217 RepID=A0ACB9FKB5_ARCLA|nr:hypothetical protein L6452_02575 [Arctium lappa]